MQRSRIGTVIGEHKPLRFLSFPDHFILPGQFLFRPQGITKDSTEESLSKKNTFQIVR